MVPGITYFTSTHLPLRDKAHEISNRTIRILTTTKTSVTLVAAKSPRRGYRMSNGAAEELPMYDLVRVRALAVEGSLQGGSLLEVLHTVQNNLGYLDENAIPTIADVLNLSKAEVQGVISFYRDFHENPRAATVVKLCRAEACQAVGAERLVAYASKRLGVAVGESSVDGQIGLEQVFCLGNCALGPSGMIDDRLIGLLDEAKLDSHLDPLLRSGG